MSDYNVSNVTMREGCIYTIGTNSNGERVVIEKKATSLPINFGGYNTLTPYMTQPNGAIQFVNDCYGENREVVIPTTTTVVTPKTTAKATATSKSDASASVTVPTPLTVKIAQPEESTKELVFNADHTDARESSAMNMVYQEAQARIRELEAKRAQETDTEKKEDIDAQITALKQGMQVAEKKAKGGTLSAAEVSKFGKLTASSKLTPLQQRIANKSMAENGQTVKYDGQSEREAYTEWKKGDGQFVAASDQNQEFTDWKNWADDPKNTDKTYAAYLRSQGKAPQTTGTPDSVEQKDGKWVLKNGGTALTDISSLQKIETTSGTTKTVQYKDNKGTLVNGTYIQGDTLVEIKNGVIQQIYHPNKK